jgi:nickel-dependent lactate racemase
MEIRVPYGHSFLTTTIPDQIGVDIIEAPATPPAIDPLGIVHSALENLLGNVAWTDFADARSVGIAISDKTRPVPHHQLLPPLMEHLAAIGIPDSAITFYIAVGAHPPMTPNEFQDILPTDILNRYKVVSHNGENDDLLLDLGQTHHVHQSGQTRTLQILN